MFLFIKCNYVILNLQGLSYITFTYLLFKC